MIDLDPELLAEDIGGAQTGIMLHAEHSSDDAAVRVGAEAVCLLPGAMG